MKFSGPGGCYTQDLSIVVFDSQTRRVRRVLEQNIPFHVVVDHSVVSKYNRTADLRPVQGKNCPLVIEKDHHRPLKAIITQSKF